MTEIERYEKELKKDLDISTMLHLNGFSTKKSIKNIIKFMKILSEYDIETPNELKVILKQKIDVPKITNELMESINEISNATINLLNIPKISKRIIKQKNIQNWKYGRRFYRR